MYPPYDPNDPRDEYGTPTGSSDPTDELQTALAAIFKQYQPQHAFSDQLSQLIGQFPQRAPEPTGWRKLLAIGGSLGGRPMAVSDGQPIGYVGNSPEQMSQSYETLTQAPYHRALNDWLEKVKPVETGAQDERYNNASMRAIMNAQANQLIAQRKIDLQGKNVASQIERRSTQDEIDRRNAATKEFLSRNPNLVPQWDAQGNLFGFDPRAGTVAPSTVVPPKTPAQASPTSPTPTVAPDGAAQSTPPQFKGVGPIQKIDETGKNQLRNTQQQGSNALAVKALGGSQRLNEIAATGAQARLTEATKEANREQLANLNAKIDKDFKFTNQTKAMMEGAQMLLPHVPELRDKATYLAEHNMFGPIMSRVREAAAKIGTTGTPEDIQKSLDEFKARVTDPSLNPNNDTAVAEFTSLLGYMASGMGRVHGGARGGGSIEMVNYMKTLLGGQGSFNDFIGRANTMESMLKGYASGPKTPINDTMGDAIDRALKSLGGKK